VDKLSHRQSLQNRSGHAARGKDRTPCAVLLVGGRPNPGVYFGIRPDTDSATRLRRLVPAPPKTPVEKAVYRFYEAHRFEAGLFQHAL